MSVYFSSGHRGRCPSIVLVTYSVEGRRTDVRAFFQRSPGTVPLHRVRHIFGGGTSSRCPRIFPAVTEDGGPSIVFVTYSVEGRRPDVRPFFQRSPGTVPLHRVRHIFGGGTSSRCPCIFPAVTGDGAPPSCSSHIRWRDIVSMSALFMTQSCH
jgi:hypothetical protein